MGWLTLFIGAYNAVFNTIDIESAFAVASLIPFNPSKVI